MSIATALKAHPAAELFPMLADDDLQKLAEDIRDNGLLEAIVLHEGMILDGRNRYAACELSGAVPRFEEWDGGNCSATVYVLSKNLHRRHLTIGQRAAIAVESLPLLHEEAKKRQGGSGRFGSSPTGQEPESATDLGSARSIAARETGVSETTLQRVIEVQRSDPEEFQRIKRGETTAHAAERKARNIPPPPSVAVEKLPKEQRVASIQKLSVEGYSASQIADEIGVGIEHVSRLAAEAGIVLAGTRASGTRISRRIDVNRIIEQTVIGAEALISGLDLIQDVDSIDKVQAPGWADSLQSTIRTLNQLVRTLRKVTA